MIPAAGEHGVDLPHPPRDIFVRQTVETKPSHAPLVKFARQRIGVVDEGVAAMKGGVETDDLRHAREGRVGGLDPREIMRLVERGQRRQRPQIRENRRVHDRRRGMVQPAVHDAVADGADHDVGKLRLDPSENQADRLFVIRQLPCLFVFLGLFVFLAVDDRA